MPPEQVWQAAGKPVTLHILTCTVSEERDIRLQEQSGAAIADGAMLIRDAVASNRRPSQTSQLETFEGSTPPTSFRSGTNRR